MHDFCFILLRKMVADLYVLHKQAYRTQNVLTAIKISDLTTTFRLLGWLACKKSRPNLAQVQGREMKPRRMAKRLCLLFVLLPNVCLDLHAWRWGNLFRSSLAAVPLRTPFNVINTRAISAYRIIASVCSRRRPTGRWWRWWIIIGGSRWGRTWRALCRLLLVVLIVCHVVLITAVCGIWILATVILGIVSSVICRAARSWRARRRRGSSGHWRLRSSI